MCLSDSGICAWLTNCESLLQNSTIKKCSQIQDCFVHFSNQRFKNLDIFIIHAQCIVSYIEKLYTNDHTLLRNLLMRMSFYLEDSSTYIGRTGAA